MVKPVPMLAKLSRPRLYDTVPRERLFACLDDNQRLPVTLVAAPPGAGKTTLVASWLESRKLGGIWYQVDAGDADPATFFHFLGLAEQALPGRPRGLPPLPPLTPEYMADLDGFARRFFRALYARLKAPAAVVLDNFQEAGDEGLFHGALLCAIDEVPRGVHLFLVSRHPPPDQYARLAANRSMAFVDWDALKLTAAEAGAIVAGGAAPLDEAAMASLHARSGGWAAGLVLLAEQSRRGHAPQSVGDPDSLAQVFAYFAGQLFDQIPTADRRLLVALSFLPSASEAMARELTGGAEAVSLLERLYRRHLFTDRRQGTDRVYTFHALFRAFLQHRAETELSDAERDDLSRRAGRLLEGTGQPEAAMPLYVSIGDFDAAEALLQRNAAGLIGQGRWKVVVDWADALPEVRVTENPWVLYWCGTARIGVDPVSARTVLERAHAIARQRGDALCQVLCAAGMVDAYFLEYIEFTPISSWIPELERMFEPGFRFPDAESELRALGAMLIAATYRAPDHPRIDHCAERVYALLTTSIDTNLRVSAGTFLTLYGTFTGHVELSRSVTKIVTPLLTDPGVHVFRRIFAWAVICWYACNASDRQLGDRAVAANLAIAHDEGMHLAERFAVVLGYFLYMDRRDIDAGRRAINRFAEIMIPSHPYEAASLVNMRSWHGVLTGDCRQSLRNAPDAVRHFNVAGSIPHIMMALNGRIWGLTEDGNEAEARCAIAEHRRWSMRRNMEWARWAPDAAEALFALRSGDEPTLCDRLRRIFAHDRDRFDQYGHQLAWARTWSIALAAAALERDVAAAHVRAYIRTFGLEPPAEACDGWPWPVRIATLGSFRLEVEGEAVAFAPKAPRKVLALLKAIIAFGGRDVKDYLLIDALWADQEGDVAHDAFRVALHRLRRLLGRVDAIVVDDGRIGLNPAVCWVDALAFEDAIQHETTAGRAHARYRGPFLPDEIAEPWTAPMRERLRRRFLHATEEIGSRLESAGENATARALYERAREVEPAATVTGR